MLSIDKNWTLFLDRDGVINIEKENGYICHWNEFWFYKKAIHAIQQLGKTFGRIIIVTNQKGVGKGIVRLEDLQEIHKNMLEAIKRGGGNVDAIYFCIDTDDDSPCRKPNAGMALQAKAAFKDIDLSKSLMVGNNLSDMYFGRNAGMKTAFLRTTQPLADIPENLADIEAGDIWQLAQELCMVYADC